MAYKIEKSIAINAPAATIWKYLTESSLMKKWMGEPEMNIEVITDWVVGSPIHTKFLHHVKIEVKGTVLQFQPYSIIQYTHLDSNAPLPDKPESYTIITFLLTQEEGKTTFTVNIENFPMETIYRLLNFYWNGTIVILKKFVEEEVKEENLV